MPVIYTLKMGFNIICLALDSYTVLLIMNSKFRISNILEIVSNVM